MWSAAFIELGSFHGFVIDGNDMPLTMITAHKGMVGNLRCRSGLGDRRSSDLKPKKHPCYLETARGVAVWCKKCLTTPPRSPPVDLDRAWVLIESCQVVLELRFNFKSARA
jgi:hypothetical protein